MRFALSMSAGEISALRATSGAPWKHIQSATTAATGREIAARSKSLRKSLIATVLIKFLKPAQETHRAAGSTGETGRLARSPPIKD